MIHYQMTEKTKQHRYKIINGGLFYKIQKFWAIFKKYNSDILALVLGFGIRDLKFDQNVGKIYGQTCVCQIKPKFILTKYMIKPVLSI